MQAKLDYLAQFGKIELRKSNTSTATLRCSTKYGPLTISHSSKLGLEEALHYLADKVKFEAAIINLSMQKENK